MVAEDGQRWGQWRYNKSNLTLEYVDPARPDNDNPYYVDIEDCDTASGMLDWLLQIHGKAWLQPNDLNDLVSALQELSGYGLQGKVHGDRRFDWKAHLLGE